MAQPIHRNSQTLLDDLQSQMGIQFFLTYVNILVRMIEEDRELSIKVLYRLMDIYQYILSHKNIIVTSLEKELSSLSAFFFLHKMIFDEGIQLDIRVSPFFYQKGILPVTILLILVNAIKKNKISEAHPLLIDIHVQDDYLVIRNSHNPKEELIVESWLEKIVKLYAVHSDIKPVILQTKQFCVVKIPLLY